MIRYRAGWLLPIAGRPVRHGSVAIHGGRIVETGGEAGAAIDVDLGRVALLPGLVNAHTHLELSYLRGQVPPAPAFVTWIRGVMASRRQRPDPQSAEIVGSVRAGIDEAVRCGTALVGDISNTLVPFPPLASSLLGGVLFLEIIRFNAPDPAAVVADACRQIDALPAASHVRVSLAAHAPYSVSPAVFRAIRQAASGRPAAPCSVHLAEGGEEVEFLESGTGPWRRFLEEVGSWDPAWTAPRSTAVRYLDQIGFLARDVLVVHGVQMTDQDLADIRSRGATLVTCPRSNQHTGAGAPPIARFYRSGVAVAVGTDSLASTPDLNLFQELAAMRRLAPEIAASQLLESATRVGATALGFGEEYGTIEVGKRGRLLAVRIPDGVTDVEEYLVSGVEPDQLFWVGDEPPASRPS